MVIHIIHSEHTGLATRFATRGVDKFSGGEFATTSSGLPVLADASVVLECSRHSLLDGGDHTILLGRVEDVALNDPTPAVYFKRSFHAL